MRRVSAKTLPLRKHWVKAGSAIGVSRRARLPLIASGRAKATPRATCATLRNISCRHQASAPSSLPIILFRELASAPKMIDVCRRSDTADQPQHVGWKCFGPPVRRLRSSGARPPERSCALAENSSGPRRLSASCAAVPASTWHRHWLRPSRSSRKPGDQDPYDGRRHRQHRQHRPRQRSSVEPTAGRPK